jgi:acyl dehydratase
VADPLIRDAGGGVRDTHSAPAFDFVVEAGKAAEFARATGADPDRLAGLAPVTFPAASALWMRPENSAWHGIDRDYRNVLHGEQRFDYPRGPLPIGAVLRARQAFGDTFDKPGRRGIMRFTEVVTTFWSDDESDPDAVMTSLSITLPPADENAASAPTPAAAAGDTRADAGSFEEAERAAALTITDFVKYQGASGDFNPIHHDAEFARSAGFPSPFAVGMLTAGLAASRIAAVRDIRRLRSYRTRWKVQAWPGDRLGFELTEREDVVDVVVTRDSGEVHMLGWAEFA